MNHNERSFPSTTFVWKKVKIQPAASPQGTARAQRAPSRSRRTPSEPRIHNPRNNAGVIVRYRGGPECWWEISYAGHTLRVQGYIQLHDALTFLFAKAAGTSVKDNDRT